MRLFVIWPEKSFELIKLMLELKKHGHEIVYWVGYEESELANLPGTIFHWYQDAILGIPPKTVNLEELPQLDEEIFRKLQKAESLILTMMNRLDVDLSLDERKHLYYHQLRYWFGLLKKYNPDYIIFPIAPHFGYDYLVFELAQLLGIKTLMFLDTRLPGRLLYMNNFWEGSVVLKQELEKNHSKNFSLMDLSGDIQGYYQKNAGIAYDLLPPHIQYQKRKYSFSYRFANPSKFLDSSIFKRGYGYLLRLWQQADRYFLRKTLLSLWNPLVDNLKKEYRRAQSNPDWSEKFVYAPLHVQPEQSTSPQGDMFVDQILMLENLTFALPKGWVIYVKEHPIQWLRFGIGFSETQYRPKGYYEKIAKIGKVKVVPMETNSYDLINKSQAVATVAGAAGWEALLRSRPSIIFGYPWYKDCPVLFRVYDVNSCREAFKKIENGFRVEQRDIINYLKSFDGATIQAYIARSAGNGAKVTWEESMQNITKCILQALQPH